ncbi:hypothetical protein CVD28_02765 [Bacillus sp. M6-12]|uniref:hypothetical protein n=1 Tax=Bacillus sp. M6-12 TaxID=2054166 RepID=UPI000C776CCC|nr:hypothetical protein [Bacillus sp. M6-12]PLS19354.1 hypothetical protein CVD28_02765 [Bacillus sp. M6-12]
MLNMTLYMKCDCGSEGKVELKPSEFTEKEELDLSESIEQNSNGLFYCHQNQPDAMDVICVMCGKETKLVY